MKEQFWIFLPTFLIHLRLSCIPLKRKTRILARCQAWDRAGRAPDFETFGVRSADGLISHATDPGGDLQAAIMQQLSELGRKLFAQTVTTPGEEGSTHRDVPDTPGDGSLVDFNFNASPNAENASMSRLEQLTAYVIESSSVFCSILRHISPHASFDMAATMLMLATYVRLAQLHHTLYAHIQSLLTSSDTQTPLVTPNSFAHVTPTPSEQSFSLNVASTRTATNWTTPSSRSPTPVVFPHLQIGEVSLAVYSRFQLKFILQICVHRLGDVEILLGLPAECCVSGLKGSQRHGRPDSEDGGILHRNTGGKTLLVQTVMMEAKGTIKGIRRILAGLTEELRSSIQVWTKWVFSHTSFRKSLVSNFWHFVGSLNSRNKTFPENVKGTRRQGKERKGK